MRKKILAPAVALSLAAMLTACSDNDADNVDENGTEDVEQNDADDDMNNDDGTDDNAGTEDDDDTNGDDNGTDDVTGNEDADDQDANNDGTDDTSYYNGSDPINQVEYEQGVTNEESNAMNNPNYYGYDGSKDGTFPGTENNQDVDWNNAEPMSETDQTQAEVFADVAAKTENVEGAQCYVMGNNAFVAIEVKSGVDDEKVINDVKDSLQKETEGMNFYIVSDYGSFDQMQQSMKAITG